MRDKHFLSMIKHDFPNIKWNEYCILDNSFDHIVIILDNRIVFRFSKSREYKEKLYDEINLLNYLKDRVKVGIPNYNYISKDKTFAGYNILSGKELSPSYLSKLSDSDKDKIADQIAEFISILHRTPESIIRKYHVRAQDPIEEYKAFVHDVEELLFPILEKHEVKAIRGYFNELKQTLTHKYSRVLIHNDLIYGHILWDSEGKQINIIDFSDRVYGDPAIDFGSLYSFGTKFVERVLELYSGDKDNFMIKRLELYSKRIPLSIMKNSLKGHKVSFEQGYREFIKLFGI